MGFLQNKLQKFSKTISSLPDQPNMQPNALKAYFDSSPEEVRQAHNGLCDALNATDAAAGLGFQRTAGVPADTVQTAVENVQQQVIDAVLGNIPSGSVDGDKLAQDVRNRFTAIENAAAAESSARASADSAETSARTTADTNLQNQINAKCSLIFGTYQGDDAAKRFISLGQTPKAVFVIANYGLITVNSTCYGGLALEGSPCYGSGTVGSTNYAVEIVSGGFNVVNLSNYNVHTNYSYVKYHYIAFV